MMKNKKINQLYAYIYFYKYLIVMSYDPFTLYYNLQYTILNKQKQTYYQLHVNVPCPNWGTYILYKIEYT